MRICDLKQCSTHLMVLCPGLPSEPVPEGKTNLDLLEQETVSGSGISWALCKSAPHSMPAPHHSSFYRPDVFPVSQPSASKQWSLWTKTKRFRKDILKLKL